MDPKPYISYTISNIPAIDMRTLKSIIISILFLKIAIIPMISATIVPNRVEILNMIVVSVKKILKL
jgi:hypothetical protein